MEMMLIALLVAAGLGPIPTEGPPPAAELGELRAQLTETLNQHRAADGLPKLERNPTAEQAAQFQADDMLSTGKMGHLDSSGRTPMMRYASFGGKADYYGENVGFRSPGVVDPVLLWNVLALLDKAMMAEVPPNDGHRRNILSPNYNGVGIGIAVGAKGIFMAEDFTGGRK
jgi:uncharacterized protein YkwD